jgi:FAD/FMN-containing dehydrogenase
MSEREQTSQLGEATIAEFSASLRGTVTQPGDADYDTARAVWNGMIDRRPALIVHCHGTADVIAAVQFARGQNLPIAVRGGGHNVAGNATCDDGIVIDLSPMRAVQVDPARRIARAQGGATLGDVDHETQAFGLATTLGMVSMTGVAGLTLGGGLGWLQRKYGLACDNLLAADVVTANGQLLRASEEENADLFWGLRGGGGNFGIVTSFEFRLYPVSTIFGGALMYAGEEQIRQGLRLYREFSVTEPDELTTLAELGVAPPEEYIPAELHGHMVFWIILCHCGDHEAAEESVRALRAFGPPAVDLVGPMPYTELQTMFDTVFPAGQRHYWRSAYMQELSDVTLDMLVDQMIARPSDLTFIDLHHMGGAVGRVAADATAFGHRDAPFLIDPVPTWTDPTDDERAIAWGRGVAAALAPHSSGSYLNFLAVSDPETSRTSYEAATYDRLAALKAKYDPTNVFRLNHNIPPRS